MTVVISGSAGITNVNGSASAPAETGSTTNTGVYFPSASTFGIATAGVNAVYVDGSQNVGVGTTSPTGRLHAYTSSALQAYFAYNTSGTQNQIATQAQANGIAFEVYDQNGSNSSISAFQVANNTGAGNAKAVAFKVDGANNVLATGSGGLGYGTGSGGTVTQATSKSTAVTLNKPTGQITMNNAALAAGAAVAFGVSNSLCSTADTVIVSASGFGSYRVELQNVGAGNFAIRVTNVSGGSLSEALVINFAIIKGATA